MADIIPTEPLFLADCIVTLGTDNFQAAISSATFTPSPPGPVVFKGLTPTAKWTRQGLADWTCDLELVQDPDTEASLSNYLHDHEGETVPAVFEPNNGGASFASTVNIVAGGIGGAVETWGTSTVSMPCTKPARTPATP